MFVDEAILIDASTQQDCTWEFQTKEDRILVFTVVGGNVKDAQQFLTVPHNFKPSSRPSVLPF